MRKRKYCKNKIIYQSLLNVPIEIIDTSRPVFIVGNGESGSDFQFQGNVFCINYAHRRQTNPVAVTMWMHLEEIRRSFEGDIINISMQDIRTYDLKSGNTLNMFLQYVVGRWKNIEVYLSGVDHSQSGRNWKEEIEGVKYCKWLAEKNGSWIFNTSINNNLAFLDLKIPIVGTKI